MARYLRTSTATLTPASGVSTLTAGAAMVKSAVALMAVDGLAYPAVTTDFAAVANAGQIIAQTNIMNFSPIAEKRQAQILGADGTLYVAGPFTNNGGYNVGCLVQAYNPATGALVGSLTVDAQAYPSSTFRLFKLSNGNFLVAWLANTGSGQVQYLAFVRPDLTLITGGGYTAAFFSPWTIDIVPLSGGGVAIVSGDFNGNRVTLQTLDNNGSGVLPITSIMTAPGTTGGIAVAAAQLSDGTLAVAYHRSPTSSNVRLKTVNVTTGATVAPEITCTTSTQTSTNGACGLLMSVMPGYVGVSVYTGGSSSDFSVYSNALALQGAKQVVPQSSTGGYAYIKLLNDGVGNFYQISGNGVATAVCIAKIPLAGTSLATLKLPLPTGYSSLGVDAFHENGYLAISVQNGNARVPLVGAVATGPMQLVQPFSPVGVAPATTGGNYASIIPLGDFAYSLVYEYGTPATMQFFIGKYMSTAIVGVCTADAIKGAAVTISHVAGLYPSAALKGSSAAKFDHTNMNITGQKGTISLAGTILKGL